LRFENFIWRERKRTKPRRGMESKSRDAPVLGAAVDGDADRDRVQ